MVGSTLRKGFIWGRIYIVLAIIFGALAILGGVMGLISQGPATWVDIPLIGIGVIQLLSGIGLWGRHKWGLYLTYVILIIHFFTSTLNLIYVLTQGSAVLNGNQTAVAAPIIGYLVGLIILALWFGYFIRRRAMFH